MCSRVINKEGIIATVQLLQVRYRGCAQVNRQKVLRLNLHSVTFNNKKTKSKGPYPWRRHSEEEFIIRSDELVRRLALLMVVEPGLLVIDGHGDQTLVGGQHARVPSLRREPDDPWRPQHLHTM